MARIFSSELHRNENASIEFGGAIVRAVRAVRQGISVLAKSRKADEYAPGAIHALRKLCEGEGQSSHIYRLEVEEWKDFFFAWLNRVKRWFPDGYADEYEKNAEDDFRVILECANEMPEYFWRNEVDKRHIRVAFKNDKDLDAARKAAEEKFPVQLGSALHEYIDRCIATLVDEPVPESPPVPQEDGSPRPDVLEPRFVVHDDGMVSLCLDRFDLFDSIDDLTQDIVTTAYDVEDAVRNYITANCSETATSLDYDCESSMFCVRSENPETLAIVTHVLIRLATDRELYLQYRSDE